MGPRCTSLSNEYDSQVPRYTAEIKLAFMNGKFVLMQPNNMTLMDVLETRDIGLMTQHLVGEMIKRDHDPLTGLFSGLMSVKPSLGIHSIEGIFSVVEGSDELLQLTGPIVIDFDGIDTLEIWSQNANFENPTPSERLLSAQLANMGFLKTLPIPLHDFILFQRQIKESWQEISQSSILTTQIREAIRKHINAGDRVFTRELTGPVQLARLLKSLEPIEWQTGDRKGIFFYKSGNSTFIKVDIEGFGMVFWIKKDRLIDTSDVKALRKELSFTLEKQIVNAHFSYLREGD